MSSGSQQQQPQQAKEGLGCHVEYAKSKVGILKATQAALDIVTLILCSVVAWSGGGWAVFVCTVCLIATIVHFLLHFLGITSRFHIKRGWNFIEMCAYSFYTLIYLINAIVIAAIGWVNPILLVGSIFAFLAFFAYSADSALYLLAWRRDLAQSTNSQPRNVEEPNLPAPSTTNYHNAGFDQPWQTAASGDSNYRTDWDSTDQYSAPPKY